MQPMDRHTKHDDLRVSVLVKGYKAKCLKQLTQCRVNLDRETDDLVSSLLALTINNHNQGASFDPLHATITEPAIGINPPPQQPPYNGIYVHPFFPSFPFKGLPSI